MLLCRSVCVVMERSGEGEKESSGEKERRDCSSDLLYPVVSSSDQLYPVVSGCIQF